MFPVSVLLPFDQLVFEAAEVDHERLTLTAASAVHATACPVCQTLSQRIHSRYTRTIADLPTAGRACILLLRVRRFFCDVPDCPRKIFAERFGAELPAFARRTLRFTARLVDLAYAAGGHGGARLAHRLAMPTSIRTLLRLLHAQPTPTFPAPQALGLDDWAWKKGRTYGTLCVDLDTHQPIDLLPDRSPDSVATWLQAHPTVTIIARDRSGGYIDGATHGAPHATQVADRWHLLKNLGDALERFFLPKRHFLNQVAEAMTQHGQSTTGARPAPSERGAGRTQASEAASLQRHTTAVERFHLIHDFRAKRVDVANIARHVGVSRETVYRTLRMTEPPPRKQPLVRRGTRLDPYKSYILQRWNDGCRSARQLWRELMAQGYAYGESSVQRYVHRLRVETGTRQKFRRAQPAHHYTLEAERSRPLTALQLARVCMTRADERQSWQARYLTYLCQADETIARTCQHVEAFVTLVRQRQGDQFDAWLAEVQATGVPEIRAFALGLQKDYAAVKAGLTLAYSNGQTEAQIHRLKLLKRAMYGQAGFELLRKRVLHRDHPLPVKRRDNAAAVRSAA